MVVPIGPLGRPERYRDTSQPPDFPHSASHWSSLQVQPFVCTAQLSHFNATMDQPTSRDRDCRIFLLRAVDDDVRPPSKAPGTRLRAGSGRPALLETTTSRFDRAACHPIVAYLDHLPLVGTCLSRHGTFVSALTSCGDCAHDSEVVLQLRGEHGIAIGLLIISSCSAAPIACVIRTERRPLTAGPVAVRMIAYVAFGKLRSCRDSKKACDVRRVPEPAMSFACIVTSPRAFIWVGLRRTTTSIVVSYGRPGLLHPPNPRLWPPVATKGNKGWPGTATPPCSDTHSHSECARRTKAPGHATCVQAHRSIMLVAAGIYSTAAILYEQSTGELWLCLHVGMRVRRQVDLSSPVRSVCQSQPQLR